MVPVAVNITGFSFVFTFHVRCIPIAMSLYYYYLMLLLLLLFIDCHKDFLPGSSSHEPAVIPTFQTLKFIIIIIIIVVNLIIIIVIIVVTSGNIRSRTFDTE